jgi:hypothetical protein
MSKGFIKRALPFVGTLVLGLFIASFFVDLSVPTGFRGHGRRHEMKRLRMENHELRNENLRLRGQLDAMHEHDPQIEQLEMAVPPLVPAPPMQPTLPHHPRIAR